jgi:hypothetical protein
VIGGAVTALAEAGRPPYLGLMAQPFSTSQTMPAVLHKARRAVPFAALAGAGLGALAVLGALMLWFHYGTAVFFEMITSGFQACF